MTRQEAYRTGRCCDPSIKEPAKREARSRCAAYWIRRVGNLPLWPEGACGGGKLDDRECPRDAEERRRKQRDG